MWNCKCDCGNNVVVIGTNLTRGTTIGCGCLRGKGKMHNTYDLSGDYGIGYTAKGEEFYFDLEDYEKIKDFCWRIHTITGYVYGYIENTKNKDISMHELIFGKSSKGICIDHINRDKRDNRKINLRRVSEYNNSLNKSLFSNNISGVAGVGYHKQSKKWRARITFNKQQIDLGEYNNFNDAVKERLLAEKKYFGDYSAQKHLYKLYGVKE